MSRTGKFQDVARGLRAMKQARERERWPLERLRAHQAAAVDDLVREVAARSPFYRDRYAGLVGTAPVALQALPAVDKTVLMENLDDALTEPRLRGRDLRSHLLDERPLLGEFRIMASSGSTGTPSLYVYSRSDFTALLAVFFRMNEVFGIRPSIPRTRIAALAAPTLASMTQRVSQAVDMGMHRLLKMSVTEPLPKLVAALNEFRPDVIHAFASVGVLLAEEQAAGRLAIAPRVVMTSGEVRTEAAAAKLEAAFGVRPRNLFASSEGLWGAECEHGSVHLFEDWCVVENVDRDGRPVPDGEQGERLLITNLFNRTLPMIRFEVSDVVVIDREPCGCGRTLPRLRSVEGRRGDVLRLRGAGEQPVAVHPTQFSLVTADPAVREFQVVQRGERIVLRLALREDAGPEAAERLVAAVGERLRAAGAVAPEVSAELVGALERTPAGKLRTVVIEEPQASPVPAVNPA